MGRLVTRQQEWLELAEKASRMELCMIYSNNDDEKTVKNLSEGSEECMGRLVTRAKKSGVINIKFSDFGLFCETVANELEKNTAICEEIGFKWNPAANME